MPSVVSSPERTAYKDASAVAALHGACVHLGTKLSDVVDPPAGPDYHWATRAHIDLLVRDDTTLEPLFAIEVDGRHHQVDPELARRDRLKDRLMHEAGIDLIRVTANTVLHSHGQNRLTGYLADLWFTSRAFYDAQDRGDVPFDEDFFHSFTFNFDSESERMESIDPSMRFLGRLWKDHAERGVPCVLVPQCWFLDQSAYGTVRAKAITALTADQFLYADVTVGMVRVAGILPRDIAEEVAILTLEHQYNDWAAGGAVARHVRDLHSLLPGSAFTFGSDEAWRISAWYSGMVHWVSERLGEERAEQLFGTQLSRLAT